MLNKIRNMILENRNKAVLIAFGVDLLIVTSLFAIYKLYVG